jgi:hypothetical protein
LLEVIDANPAVVEAGTKRRRKRQDFAEVSIVGEFRRMRCSDLRRIALHSMRATADVAF